MFACLQSPRIYFPLVFLVLFATSWLSARSPCNKVSNLHLNHLTSCFQSSSCHICRMFFFAYVISFFRVEFWIAKKLKDLSDQLLAWFLSELLFVFLPTSMLDSLENIKFQEEKSDWTKHLSRASLLHLKVQDTYFIYMFIFFSTCWGFRQCPSSNILWNDRNWW